MKPELEFESDIDALVGVAMFGLVMGHIDRKKFSEGYAPLALKQFRRECPTNESQQVFVDAYLRRYNHHHLARRSSEFKAKEALKFWFEVVWPYLPWIRSHPAYQRFLQTKPKPTFAVGQLVRHRRFGYRGVIVEANPEFEGDERWYEDVARSRPPKNRPWYHVLVHKSLHLTYVAERHLDRDRSHRPIEHPFLEQFFERFEDGRYHPTGP